MPMTLSNDYILQVANTINAQLREGRVGRHPGIMVLGSWGYRMATTAVIVTEDVMCPALQFNVSGRKHVGRVYVALNSGDTYDVYFKHDAPPVASDVYVEELLSTLDSLIES